MGNLMVAGFMFVVWLLTRDMPDRMPIWLQFFFGTLFVLNLLIGLIWLFGLEPGQ